MLKGCLVTPPVQLLSLPEAEGSLGSHLHERWQLCAVTCLVECSLVQVPVGFKVSELLLEFCHELRLTVAFVPLNLR